MSSRALRSSLSRSDASGFDRLTEGQSASRLSNGLGDKDGSGGREQFRRPRKRQGLISVSTDQALHFVAGTGFEPVTSGIDGDGSSTLQPIAPSGHSERENSACLTPPCSRTRWVTGKVSRKRADRSRKAGDAATPLPEGVSRCGSAIEVGPATQPAALCERETSLQRAVTLTKAGSRYVTRPRAGLGHLRCVRRGY